MTDQPDKLVATLIIHGIPDMSKQDCDELLDWLYNKADEVEIIKWSEDQRKEYAKMYRNRLYQTEGKQFATE